MKTVTSLVLKKRKVTAIVCVFHEKRRLKTESVLKRLKQSVLKHNPGPCLILFFFCTQKGCTSGWNGVHHRKQSSRPPKLYFHAEVRG